MPCRSRKRASPRGKANLTLVGGAYNAMRWDVLLAVEQGGLPLKGSIRSGLGSRTGWRRCAWQLWAHFWCWKAATTRRARGARPRARLSAVVPTATGAGTGARSKRPCAGEWNAIAAKVDRGHAAIISGAGGLEPATSAELTVLKEIGLPVRNTGTYIGHGVETQFMANLAIGCAVIEHGKLFAPTGTGDTGRKPARAFPGRRHQRRQLARRRSGAARTGRLRESAHDRRTACTRDKAGRPMSPSPASASSLRSASAKTDNWAKLAAGVSGIRRISRFPTDGLRTTIAGTVDDVYQDYMPPAELSERIALLAGEEAIAQAGHRQQRAISPARCFWRRRRSKSNGTDRIQMAEMAAPTTMPAIPT